VQYFINKLRNLDPMAEDVHNVLSRCHTRRPTQSWNRPWTCVCGHHGVLRISSGWGDSEPWRVWATSVEGTQFARFTVDGECEVTEYGKKWLVAGVLLGSNW